MIDRGKAVMSAKLRKQLKALERKPENILFGQILDEVSIRINTPKKRRIRK